MGVFESFAKKEDVIAEGEERLYMQYDYTQEQGRVITAVAAIDAGSTQTRITLMDRNDVGNYADYLGEEFVIPSTSVVVSAKEEISPAGPELYDNMDSTIINTGDSVDAIISERVRLVRGAKTLAVNAAENRIDSAGNKIMDATFYYNVLDAIGYAVIEKFSGKIPSKVIVQPSIALPPGEATSGQLAVLKYNLTSYKWKHNDSGLVIDFEFSDKIETLTEPEADCQAFYAVNGEEMPELVLHINGGGRSFGTALLRNGRPVPMGHVAIMQGGTELLDMMAKLCLDKTKGQMPKRLRKEAAIRSGKLKSKGDTLDIVPEIKESKNDFARQIFMYIRTNLFGGESKFSPLDIDVVSVSGGVFDPGDYDYSLAQPLGEYIGGLAQNASFVRYEESYIVQGLFLNAIQKFFKTQDVIAAVEAAIAAEEAEEQSKAAGNQVAVTRALPELSPDIDMAE